MFFSRKGQMEMIGLVFIIIILVFGFLFYVSFAENTSVLDKESIKETSLTGIALETSMLETTVPECGYSLSTALERCTTSNVPCGQKSVCQAAYDAYDEMLASYLGDQYTDITRFNYYSQILINDALLSRGGYVFEKVPFPSDCNEDSDLLSRPTQPIFSRAGQLSFIIGFCE